jgi:hypothetical protein
LKIATKPSPVLNVRVLAGVSNTTKGAAYFTGDRSAMRRVIQRTVTTTKIISLTITHSESEEAIEYTLIDDADALDEPLTSAAALAAEECAIEDELPAGDASGAARPQPDTQA